MPQLILVPTSLMLLACYAELWLNQPPLCSKPAYVLYATSIVIVT
mgnify:CR=1 FL=1